MNHSAVLRESNNLTRYVSDFIPMNGFVAASNVICSVVGMPLNLLIAFFIILKRRLHKTRNIIWLGVALSNVLILSHYLLEVYAYQTQSATARKIFTLGLGLPYASLMLNLFFSLVDRYISIGHSVWYKRNVTITWIVSGQIGCFSILFVLMKGLYFIEFLISTPSEGLTNTEMKIISIVGFIILFVCIVCQVFVYVKIKHYFEKGVDISLSTRRRAKHNYNAKERQANRNMETTEFMEGEPQENSLDGFPHQQTTASKQRAVTPSSFFIQIGNDLISRLELEAALHAVDRRHP